MRKPIERHILDSSIFLSLIKGDEWSEKVLRYLARVKMGLYEAYVTNLVIGEVTIVILSDVEEEKILYALSDLYSLLKHCKIHTPKISQHLENLEKIKSIEQYHKITDARIIAEAMELKNVTLVTTDSKLVRDSFVNELISIKHIKDFKFTKK